MDMEILRLCMQSFRNMFVKLSPPEGKDIGVDPFQYNTIAAVAFDGIYRRFFLPPNAILVVPRPGKQAYSNMQIAWLNYVARNKNIHLQHVNNSHKLGAGEVQIPIQAHMEYKRGKNTAKVDGYDPLTKTVYEFHGCFWHGCPYCYKPSQIVPMCSYMCVDKKGKTIEVRVGNLYANTQRKMMKLWQSEYLVVKMWECEWKKLCKQNKINPSGDISKPYLEPLVPRDAYFEG